MDYAWYELVSKSEIILQGDFVEKCPIVVPPKSITEAEIEIHYIDAIILSQSCDLENDKLEIVLVAPYYSLKKFLELLPKEKVSTTRAKGKAIDELKKGYLPAYHLLNKWNPNLADYQVVDFRNVYGINVLPLKEICKDKDRIRLLPPYREHLSQAFARYFMRVGLPQNLIVEGY